MTWEDYPAPRLKERAGIWNVRVTIPKKIKFLFSNGSTEKRVSTNTTDKKLAKKRILPKCHEIYREFDKSRSIILIRKNSKRETERLGTMKK